MELGMPLLNPGEAFKMFILTGALLLEYVNAYNWYGRSEEVCYILRYREARINRNYIDKYASARTLRDCERACDQAFFACKSFSYSDSQSEQCLLSRDDTTHALTNRREDFDNDRDFSYYERKTGRDCDDYDGGSYQPDRQGSYGNDECYSLKKTRERIDQRYVRQTRRTSDRTECEDLCSRESYCRGFNYRYKSHGTYQYKDNCELSEEDTRGADRRAFYTDDEFDFYEKSSSSSDCNRGSTGDRYTTSRPTYNRDDECFRLHKSNYGLDDHVVRDTLNVRDKQECEEKCLRSSRFTCRAFAYKRDSNSGRNSNSGRTWGNSGNSWYDQQDNCFLSDRSGNDISNYDFIFDRDSEIYDLNQNGRDCNGYGREDNYDHNGDGGHYTVSNLECNRRGRCREDHTAGYWWCEYDDAGAWDYCCRPDEECGRSRNYEDLFAWCYVGAGASTQWRTCSTNDGNSYNDRQYLKQDDPPNVTTTQVPYNQADSVEVVDLNSIL